MNVRLQIWIEKYYFLTLKMATSIKNTNERVYSRLSVSDSSGGSAAYLCIVHYGTVC